jgi:hypothetical protein
MTRRKFISRLIKAGSAVIVGTWLLAKKAVPRKFVRAKAGRFPGSLKPLTGICKQSKWSG